MYTSLASLVLLGLIPSAYGSGFRTIGSSGCTAQMVFLPPNTSTVVFIDNFHDNYGGPGVNLQTGAHSPTAYTYDDGSGLAVFGTEYNLETNELRKLKPLSNTFCSAGSFYADGTLLNLAGAEAGSAGVAEGFDKLRTYAPGPCTGNCTQDWVEQSAMLQHYRWYPTAQTMVDGNILLVGGADAGGLVLNEADINVPTYEKVYQDGRAPPAPVALPILNFTADQNLIAGKSYNLYPNLHLLPNAGAANQILTIAGNQTIIWDYGTDELVKTLPDTPQQARTFPSSAMSVMLPLRAPDYTPRILLCGGSSGDIPNPVGLDDCYTMDPLDANPTWVTEQSLPNGAQTMSDGILLPDGTVLIINGARTGCGGGYQADDPVYEPLIYNGSAPAGSRFTSQAAGTIPRLYHSVATLLPSGEVLLAGSNPAVGYSESGAVPAGWPSFYNNGHVCALYQQQRNTSYYPTEYRVEIYSPPYMNNTAAPSIRNCPTEINYDDTFQIDASVDANPLVGNVEIMLSHTGFHTHGLAMGQRMIQLTATPQADTTLFNVVAPRNASVIPPGMYLIFAVENHIPSGGVWIHLT